MLMLIIRMRVSGRLPDLNVLHWLHIERRIDMIRHIPSGLTWAVFRTRDNKR